MRIPYLQNRNGHKVLMVNEQPFIMLAGEIHNSSASNASFMENIWKKADEFHLNSVLIPVYWELIEPEENQFDFTLVDAIIEQARKYGKKIGFLWFGSWKNAQCYYAPEWVKTDLERFPRAQLEKGLNFKKLENVHNLAYTSLSAFGSETKKADAKAFAAFMKHLKSADEHTQTVVTVQVENEVGLLGEAREHSDLADSYFEASVPSGFIDFLRQNYKSLSRELTEAIIPEQEICDEMSWREIFGEMADEVFTAYYTAEFVETVAAAGKREYPLPMVVNCWLDKGQKPGKYPSGGPVAKLIDIWKFVAPSIDLYAPDIYVPLFLQTCDQYAKNENPLYIAECATHSYAAIRLMYAVGHYHAACFSPFGFEDIGQPFTMMQGMLFGMDTEDELLKTPQNPIEYGQVNRILSEMMPLLGEAYGSRRLQASIHEKAEREILHFSRYDFEIDYNSRFLQSNRGACMILEVDEDTYYALVTGCGITVRSTNETNPFTDYLSVDEGEFHNGQFVSYRRLNGDEITTMTFEELTLLRIRLFSYN